MTREEAIIELEKVAIFCVNINALSIVNKILPIINFLHYNPCDNCYGVGLGLAHGEHDLRIRKGNIPKVCSKCGGTLEFILGNDFTHTGSQCQKCGNWDYTMEFNK